MAEMQIRLAAAMKQHNVTHPEIAGKLFMDAEDTIGITLAAETRDGIETNDAFLSHMRDKIKANDIGFVIIDRSEERRVGKEWRSRWAPSEERKKTVVQTGDT